MMNRLVFAFVIVFGCSASALAQGVGDLIWGPNAEGEFLLSNPTGAAIAFDGYTLACEAGCLDPDGWRTIPEAVAEDASAVIATLGIGALSMGPAGTPSGNQLSELNLAGAATLQPGASWSFGHPIPGTFEEVCSILQSGAITATMSGQGQVIHALAFCPEPGSISLASLAAIALLAGARRRRDFSNV